MEVSLNQAFEDSQMAIDNYFAYISRQNDEQKEQINELSHPLDSIIEGIDAVGTVAAMAAKESMQSHNTIFGMLKAMNTEQGLLIQMIVEIKRNGGSGSADGNVLGEALGGGLESVAMVGAIDQILTALGMATLPEFVLPAMVLLGGLKGASDQENQNAQKLGEQTHPNSLTNKALEASAEAERFINGAYYSVNPAPNPFMNGPGMLLDGWSRKNFPVAKTFGEAMTVVAAINEANDYLEATGQIPTRPRIWDDYSPNDEYGNLMRHNGVEPDEMTYGLNTEYDHFMRYNSQAAIAAMPPQAAQVVVQTAPSEAPEQTINIHMNNEIKGAIYDSRAFKDLSDYLVERLREQFNRRGVRYSDNW